MTREKTKRTMSSESFVRLERLLQQAVEHIQGKRHDFRVTLLPMAPSPMTSSEVIAIREQLNTSQAIFARLLNKSV